MEILSPSFLPSSSLWFEDYCLKSRWTKAENKIFERALAVHDKETPDRWHKVAAMIPGKTVVDVIKQYKELEDDVRSIEEGYVPFPIYDASAFTLELVNRHGFPSLKQQEQQPLCGKRSATSRSDMERKKGIPWTEEEHKLFLMGLKRYGKGDWRNISRNFVITRTPTQVASHAQKYFIRQLTGGKDKRRASIHDITTVNLTDPPSTNSGDKNAAAKQPSTTAGLRHWSLQRSSIPAVNSHGNLLLPPPPSSRMQLPVLNEPCVGIRHDHDYFVA